MSAKRSNAANRAFLLALAYIVMGVLFCIKGGEVLKWVMLVAGILFIVQGILDLIARNIFFGILEIVAGAAILAFGMSLLHIATLVLGIVIIVYSISGLFSRNKNFWTVLACILSLAVGILLVVNHWIVYDWFFILLGVTLIVNGVLTLFEKR